MELVYTIIIYLRMSLSRLKTVITRERFLRTAALIFLHGQESSASDLKNNLKGLLMKDFDFDHIQVIYPQSPIQKSFDSNTLCDTTIESKRSWFHFEKDRYNPTFKENIEEIECSCELVKEIVHGLTGDGVKMERIVMGGYNQGAQIAMHAAFRYFPGIAGVFGLSTHLSPTSAVYKTIEEAKQNDDKTRLPPLYMFHGYADEIVKFSWAKQTANRFIDLDTEIHFEYGYGLNHEITLLQLVKLKEWIHRRLPNRNRNFGESRKPRKKLENP